MKKVVTVFITSVLFLACSNPDESEPRIRSVRVNDLETDHLHAIAGTINTVTVQVDDDKELSQVKCELITPSGFHVHSDNDEFTTGFISPNSGVWDTLIIRNIQGITASESFDLQLPDTISGGWKMEIAVLDKNGNLESQLYTLNIQNDNLPAITPGLTDPPVSIDGFIYVTQGGSLELTGHITDPDSLSLVRIALTRSFTQVYMEEWSPVGSWTFDLGSVELPALLESGTYILRIDAVDLQGWSQYKQATIRVLP